MWTDCGKSIEKILIISSPDVDNILCYPTNDALYVEHIIDVPGIFVKAKNEFFSVSTILCGSIHYNSTMANFSVFEY
jgi:hypothetical protein